MLQLFDNKYPYTDFHELNLDWLINKVIAMNVKLDNFVSLNTIKYANPIDWDITKQYELNTVVIDPVTGTAYISVKPVPQGVSLSNGEYWTEIFNLQQIISGINNNLTVHDNGGSPTALGDLQEGDWLLWNNVLYVALHNISAGSAFIIDSNISQASVEELVFSYRDALYLYIGLLSDLTTTDKSSIVSAINELVSTITMVISDIGVIASLLTTDKSSLVNAINEVFTDLHTLINNVGDLSDLNTTDKSSIVNAINEVITTINTQIIAIIGDLGDLNTTDKSNIVNAINEVLGDVDNLQDYVNERTEDIFNVRTLDLDWTQDITADIEALIPTHKRLYFPAGDYYFSITITEQDIEIFGDGFYERTMFHPTSGACIKLDARNGVNCGDFYLHDVSITSTSKAFNGLETVGDYDTDPINNVVVRDVFISGVKNGILWKSRGIWCVFDHVWCYSCLVGMFVQPPNDCAFNHNSFTDCMFGNNDQYGVYMISTNLYRNNCNQFNHCNIQANWWSDHNTGDVSNGFINCNAVAFVDCYFEGEFGVCDLYVRDSDITVRGGVNINPQRTFVSLVTANSWAYIIGLHGYLTSTCKITDSGSYNNHCVVIGSTNSGYQMNSAYVIY